MAGSRTAPRGDRNADRFLGRSRPGAQQDQRSDARQDQRSDARQGPRPSGLHHGAVPSPAQNLFLTIVTSVSFIMAPVFRSIQGFCRVTSTLPFWKKPASAVTLPTLSSPCVR